MKRMHRSIHGFTLVEVMVLLVIIALLLVMAIPALQKIRQGKQERAPIDNLSAPAKQP
jgi:prepilin-type N-terminal cleavage/methylation domain-containing protein